MPYGMVDSIQYYKNTISTKKTPTPLEGPFLFISKSSTHLSRHALSCARNFPVTQLISARPGRRPAILRGLVDLGTGARPKRGADRDRNRPAWSPASTNQTRRAIRPTDRAPGARDLLNTPPMFVYSSALGGGGRRFLFVRDPEWDFKYSKALPLRFSWWE